MGKGYVRDPITVFDIRRRNSSVWIDERLINGSAAGSPYSKCKRRCRKHHMVKRWEKSNLCNAINVELHSWPDFAVVAVGNASVGKTCLIKHFCESKFSQCYHATVGVDYGFKVQNIKGIPIRVSERRLVGFGFRRSRIYTLYRYTYGICRETNNIMMYGRSCTEEQMHAFSSST